MGESVSLMVQKSIACWVTPESALDERLRRRSRRIALALDAIEARARLRACCWRTRAPSSWTRRCISHSDELLLIADAAQPPAVHAIEQTCLTERPARSEAAEILLLLHPADSTTPSDTREWLARRPVTGHVHVRLGTRARRCAPGAACLHVKRSVWCSPAAVRAASLILASGAR